MAYARPGRSLCNSLPLKSAVRVLCSLDGKAGLPAHVLNAPLRLACMHHGRIAVHHQEV